MPNHPKPKAKPVHGKHKKEFDQLAHAQLVESMADEEREALEKAVLKIQATVRGHLVRALLRKKPKANSQLFSQDTTLHLEKKFDQLDERMTDLLMMHVSDKKEYWTQGTNFNIAVGGFVVINAVLLGAESDLGSTYPAVFQVFEYVFCVVFGIELALHFGVEGPRVYFSDRMNWLDFFLVVMSIVDVLIAVVGVDAGNLKIVSLLRMLRLTRLARLLRLFRMFKELHLIVSGFIDSIRTLFWAFIFLLIVVYACSIWVRMMIGDADRCGDLPEVPGETCDARSAPRYIFNPEVGDQHSLFGRIDQSMLTLFLCFTEGCNMDVVRPIVLETPWMILFWIMFIFFTTYGILNLIIGLFLDNALKTAAETERDILATRENYRRETLNRMREVFVAMDIDSSGTITKAEFFSSLQENSMVRACFVELGLDKEENLFDTLDADRAGSITFDDFFEGVMLIMKGQETAKAKDMVCTNLLCQAILRNTASAVESQQKITQGHRDLSSEVAAARKLAERTSAHTSSLLERMSELQEDLLDIQAAFASPKQSSTVPVSPH